MTNQPEAIGFDEVLVVFYQHTHDKHGVRPVEIGHEQSSIDDAGNWTLCDDQGRPLARVLIEGVFT